MEGNNGHGELISMIVKKHLTRGTILWYDLTMSISLHKKFIRGHLYWYARECQRIDGKPKIVWQKYLGKAESIVQAMGVPSKPPRPKKITLYDFAGPAALYDITQKLDLISIIDGHAGKRNQGVSVGTYITLAAINRCLAPTSKARMAEWYQSTVLSRLLPVKLSHLTSQRFWDHMSYLDVQQIGIIEQDLTRTLIERFQVDLSCLLYDTTNFYTFIDTFNDASTLAQRGKSKERRADLRIIGLALLVTQDFHIPLFHHVYPGNIHDSSTFASVTDTLVARYKIFCQSVEGITIVYDKGNNSEENQQKLDSSPYHFVGSLCPSQHPDLLKIPLSRFRSLTAQDLEGVLAYRTQKHVLGASRTILITYNPELFLTQSSTILRQLRKRTRKLKALQMRLLRPPTKGKSITAESVRKQVCAILSAQHMKELIKTEITEGKGDLRLAYRVDQASWNRLQRTLLGKNILFTDQQSWSDEAIVHAYWGQYHIEEAFKRMKNPHFVSWRPLHHWTDQKIRVHAFYCVLALLLSSLLRRTLAHKGIELSIVKILDTLSKVKEVVLLYPGPKRTARPVTDLTTLSPLQKQLFEALDLKRFLST
jgi:transposase